MKEPIFSHQRWRLQAFALAQTFLKKYHGRGQRIARVFVERYVLSDSHYFQAKYLGNAKLWVCPKHTVGRHILQKGVYEPYTCFCIDYFVKNGFSFIDIGANIGTHTIAAAIARTGSRSQKIVAFEPSPYTFKVLLENCLLNEKRDIECIMAAVSNRSGEGLLLHPEKDPALVAAAIDQAIENSASDDICKFVSLDDYFSKEIWAAPVLVKIDVQGFEALVFRGAYQSLGELSDLAIIFEIDKPWLEKAGFTLQDMRESVEMLKFERFFVLHENSGKRQETTLASIEDNLANTSGYVNILAIKGHKVQTLIDALV